MVLCEILVIGNLENREGGEQLEDAEMYPMMLAFLEGVDGIKNEPSRRLG